jgi:hypothetical protein
VQEKAIKSWKINLKELSYYAKGSRVINLGADENNSVLTPSIILTGTAAKNTTASMVWWNDLSDEVN